MYLRPQSKIFKKKRKLARLIRLASTSKYSAPKLAKVFKCNRKTILLALDDNDISLPNLGQFRKTLHCDEDFFDRLNSISSYWLGFIAADGCLALRDKGLTIGLASKDKNHLRKFKRAIQANSKIFYTPATKSVKFSVYSERIFNRLGDLGILPNKSLSIKRVMVPEGLLSHFILSI